MQPIVRIEIVIDALHSSEVVDLLARVGLKGYTLIRNVSGAGERGRRQGDDITGVDNNHYVLTTCAPDAADRVAASLRPLLERVGGICLMSDARWLQH